MWTSVTLVRFKSFMWEGLGNQIVNQNSNNKNEEGGPPLPSIFLSNVRSINNKNDELNFRIQSATNIIATLFNEENVYNNIQRMYLEANTSDWEQK